MALKDELALIEKQVNKLLVTYKENSDDYKITGMLDEYDASKIIDGSVKVIRKQLDIITKDYSLSKKQNSEISAFLDKIRKKLDSEVLKEDILVHGYGVYKNRYGIIEEKTVDEAYRDFIYESREKLNSISVQKMRLGNFSRRRKVEKWKYWAPIIVSNIISILALAVSIITLCKGVSNE